jgi:hypothetical protein
MFRLRTLLDLKDADLLYSAYNYADAHLFYSKTEASSERMF